MLDIVLTKLEKKTIFRIILILLIDIPSAILTFTLWLFWNVKQACKIKILVMGGYGLGFQEHVNEKLHLVLNF